VTEAESQAVLNALKEYDLQGALKNGRSVGRAEGGYFEGDGGQ
jgi:hypothetical protein